MLDNLSPTGTDGQSDEQLIQKIQDLLREKRYVIVFDDVWTVDAWESIRLVLPTPCNNRSRIIVTTRNETVAYTSCTQNHRYVYKLEPLSPQHSFDLFCRRVFGPDHPCPEELNKLSVDILKRCAGLPLAIVTIGGLLASKPNKTEQEWKKIINHLGSELESNPSLEGMKHVLTLSYNDLPYPVKRCFLYLSIFPEDHEIRRKHLQTLWIAEGLIVKGHRGADSEEEVAEAYFNELIARSMILPSSFSAADGRVKSFRVHDVMLELIVSKSAEYNFVSVLGEHHSPAGIIRRLSVHGGGGPSSTDYSLESMDLSHVRTYSTFGVADPKYLVSSCRRLRLLTVLDLQGCHSLVEFREISKLRHLVYLSLRGTNIRSLPESIGKLQKLETLDIRDSSIDLPANIVKIRRLRVLRAGDRFPSVYPPSIPRRFGRLERLQTMADVAISHRGMAEELRKLRRLRKLGLVLRTTDAKDCCTSLGNLSTGLRSLRIVFYWSNLIADNLSNLEAVSPPPLLLHTLGLAGDLSGLPSWVSQLNNVVKIKLYETGLRNDAIQVLQSLPSLVQLSLLHDSYMEENLSFGGQGQFSALKVLRLVRLQQLKSLRFSGGAMPKLERLFIGGCPLEGGEDEGINYLPRLKEILVSDLPDQVFHRLQEATQAHHNHPTFNPYVGRM